MSARTDLMERIFRKIRAPLESLCPAALAPLDSLEMEDSWSFDGSIVSLSDSIGPPDASPASIRPDDDSAVSAHTDNRAASAAAPSDTSGEPALAFSASRIDDMSTAAPPAERDERDRACGPTSTVPPHATLYLAGTSTAPTELSPETTVGQTVSRGRPGVRTRGGGGGGGGNATAPAATRSTSVSSTTSTDGSAASSSLPSSSTKMSDAETTSEQDGAGTSAFVMPSLNMGGGTTTTARYATTENSSAPEVAAATSQRLLSGGRSEADRVRILVLGSTADDRRTFAKLVSLDDDDDDEDRSRHRVQSSASSEGVTDMSFSFLSTRPAPSNPRTEPRSANLPRPPNEDETFEALSPRAGSATLFQLADDERSTARLLDKLQMPFERLEAKISRTYPATDRLADLVSSASCGSFDACLFLFSSPPTAKEVALARPVSRLVPLFPVLLLPPPPSGKSQKTNALCHAVQEQLNGADVRWLPASSLGKNSRRRSGGGGGGPLFMLPHDLFAQQPPPVFDSHAGPCGDSPPFSAPLLSRDSPNSLASSQELFALPPTPHSPALTAMSSAPPSSIGTGEERPGRYGARRESGGGGGVRSLLASGLPSTRASSSASRSDSRRRSQQRRRRGHRGGGGGHSSTGGGGGGSSSESDSTSDSRHMYGSSTSLADLKRLQFVLHDPKLSDTLRHLVARAFLEWREVEIAATTNGSSRDFPTAETRADLPSAWGETLLEDERGAFQDTGVNARKGLDFSRRVAERRQALRASAAPPPQSRGTAGLEQTQTQTQTQTQEEETEGAPITASTTRESTTSSAYWTDPTTPRCIQRGLPSFAGGIGGATTLDRTGGEGYFPSTSNASVPWLDSGSEFASSSTQEGQQPATAPRPLSPSSLVYLSPADPFHLPSLIHLVGLNLRLAFDPAAALARSATSPTPADEETAAEGTKSTSVWSWWRTAATVGLVFAAGVAIGAHVISRRAILFGPAPTLATAAVIASPADWASWSPAVLIRS